MSAPEFDAEFREKLALLFAWRRDVRRFKRDPIDAATIADLVREAAHSPSVGFSQPWRFVRVDTPQRRAAVLESFQRANADALGGYRGEDAERYASLKLSGLREAPVQLAVFCDNDTAAGKGLGRQTMPETLAYSVAMCVYTFWLAARACDIGVGWVSILEPEGVTRLLDVPGAWRLVAYLCVGYPEEPSAVPELQRAGWEAVDDRSTTLYER